MSLLSKNLTQSLPQVPLESDQSTSASLPDFTLTNAMGWPE